MVQFLRVPTRSRKLIARTQEQNEMFKCNIGLNKALIFKVHLITEILKRDPVFNKENRIVAYKIVFKNLMLVLLLLFLWSMSYGPLPILIPQIML